MKDKRTYKTRKEHSNDMSYENEATITNEDKGESSLILLIENHTKEIWEWKQKESQWIRDKNQLDGSKIIIAELSNKFNEMDGRLQSALDINEDHQRYNGKLQTELTEVQEDNKKLARQVEELEKKRKFGDGTY